MTRRFTFFMTDHAILRFLERCHGIDLTDLRRDFSTEEKVVDYLVNENYLNVEAIYRFFDTPALRLAIDRGATRVKRSDGHLVLRRNAIVTILP